MKLQPEKFNLIFQQAIKDYHKKDDVDQKFVQPDYTHGLLESLLYRKCWIDTVQWHLEDIIRNPDIAPTEAIKIKRRIDASNQDRTDLVEQIDDFFQDFFSQIKKVEKPRINTESVGWALDRLSILNLKVYHWREETERTDASAEHLKKSREKLGILQNQYTFLTQSIAFLLEDMQAGRVIAQTFKQMKMYNDPETNPILRAAKK